MTTDNSVKARTLFHLGDWVIVEGMFVDYCYAVHTGCKLEYDNRHPSNGHAMVPGRPTECGRCHTSVSDEIYALVKLMNWETR